MILTLRSLIKPVLPKNCMRIINVRTMATERARLPHEDRTSQEPRDGEIHPVVVDSVDLVNDTVRLFKLRIKDQERGIQFLAGQWLDVFTPNTPKAGGFTITSTPSQALPSTVPPYLELAIQKSPDNPPAAWLWQSPSAILGQELKVRVGGSFTWPPDVDSSVENVVFVAGGVGINPLISMISHIHQTIPQDKLFHVTFVYTTKPYSDILFLARLRQIAASVQGRMKLRVFITGHASELGDDMLGRRFDEVDLTDAVGRGCRTVCYVCGPPKMTDEAVEFLGRLVGSERVFCEKWW